MNERFSEKLEEPICKQLQFGVAANCLKKCRQYVTTLWSLRAYIELFFVFVSSFLLRL